MPKVETDEMSAYYAARTLATEALAIQGAFGALCAIRLNDSLVKAGYDPAIEPETLARLATLAHVDL